MATSPAMVVLEAAVAFMAALSSFFACSTLPCRTTAASAHAPSIMTFWKVLVHRYPEKQQGSVGAPDPA
jgi:hypothetical protein